MIDQQERNVIAGFLLFVAGTMVVLTLFLLLWQLLFLLLWQHMGIIT